MSVTTSLPDVRSQRSPLFRAILILGLVLLVIILGGAAWLYSIARSALPQIDGSVAVSGLSGKVRVVRDNHGIPTIEAASLDDLFFAQGYVTAQDRLWQMDAMRRAAAGELSEILGPSLLKMDREQRILGLRAATQDTEKAMSARDRAYFEAYARGVNAFMESHRDKLSLEFRLLKYSPKPWTVADSLLVGARMVQDLNHYSYARALTREKILAKLGPELTSDLYTNSSWRDRPPAATRPRIDEDNPAVSSEEEDDDDDEGEPVGGDSRLISASRATSGAVSLYGTAEAAPFHFLVSARPVSAEAIFEGFSAAEADLFRPGSNNWVVSGEHTVTGKPLLSNDMHLDHQMPNLWFAAHLKSGTYEVAGVTLPGTPFVIVGHNQRIGWGFTNVGPTVEDVFIEEFNDHGQYKTPAGWRDPQHRQEVIHVKNQPDVTLDVVTTRHGPIITDIVPGETRKIALRWILYDGMTLPFFDVNSAQNWDEFRKAFSVFVAPGQNVMYADVDGHIGYQTTGKIPIRASGDGSLPVSGSDDAHEWKGYIPWDEMPRVYDPQSGVLASANGRITPDGYKYSISTEWEAPWRTDRIYRVLESGKKFAPADMLALQMDVSSTYDHFCADKFVYALDHAGKISDKAKKAADILRDWDGRMSADSAAPSIETKARKELERLILEPKLGVAPSDPADNSGTLNWKSYRWGMSTVWMETILTKQPARWLPSTYKDYPSLLVAAVENVLKQPDVPSDVSQWKWGKIYPVDVEHPVLSHLPLVGKFTGPGVHPLSGSGFTVKAVGKEFGPSERVTWNFADFDKSTLNLVTGESGIFLSKYYMDQWPAWYGGRTFNFAFSAANVEKRKQHEMTLVPQ
ncbi:MAG: penicillin acylase family protein [Acidobacteria bacterium]|nr:penicillin acylase family protein [Acidobacteriota bacterium]